MSRRLAAPVALVLWIAALSGVRAEAQTTFYEAYENGLAHEKAGAWPAARESFLKASALRPQPARRVKSYGLNFIDVYDPAIHLARAALRLGLLDEAARAVEVSRAASVSPAADVAALAAEIDAARARAAPPPRAASAEPATPLPRAEGPAAAVPTLAPAAGAPPSVPSATALERAASPDPAAPGAPSGERVVATRAATGRTPSARPVEAPTAEAPSSAAVAPAAPAPGPAPAPTATAVVPAGRSDGAPDSSKSSRTLAWIGAILAAAVTVVAVKAGLMWRARRGAAPTPIAATPEPILAAPAPIAVAPDTGGSGAAASTPDPSRGGAAEASAPSLSLDPATAYTRVESRPLRPGTDPHFGAYALEGVLGRGGMGTTYLARRTRDGFPVALKVPHEHILDQPDFAERFLREGGLGAMLHHPNIVRIYEAGEHAGRAFIAMELLRGQTLEQTLRSQGTLPVAKALHVARGIALALDYAHLKGIVHRDLKPENVMLLPDGQVKVMDYGIARRMDLAGLTGTDTYLGTPSYSAPETISPVDVGPRADLYSLGIILYRMLSGALPFTAATPFELLHKHAVEPLPPIAPDRQVPPEVLGLVLELTAKDPRERYASAELFLRDVDRILNRM